MTSRAKRSRHWIIWEPFWLISHFYMILVFSLLFCHCLHLINFPYADLLNSICRRQDDPALQTCAKPQSCLRAWMTLPRWMPSTPSTSPTRRPHAPPTPSLDCPRVYMRLFSSPFSLLMRTVFCLLLFYSWLGGNWSCCTCSRCEDVMLCLSSKIQELLLFFSLLHLYSSWSPSWSPSFWNTENNFKGSMDRTRFTHDVYSLYRWYTHIIKKTNKNTCDYNR